MEAIDRIYEVTGATTQVALSQILDIRQSSVSAATSRNHAPAEWRLTLLRKYGVNPEWVIGKSENKYMAVVADAPEIANLSSFSTAELLQEIAQRTRTDKDA